MSEVKLARMKERPKEWFEALSERSKKTSGKAFLGKHHTEKSKKELRDNWIKKYPKIQCEQTGEIFDCQRDIAIKYKIKQGHISEQLNGKRLRVNKYYTFKYVK